MLPRAALLLLAATLAGCSYPDYVSGTAPSYPSGYQPTMGGYATEWPAQPGALWGPEDVPNIAVFREPLSAYGRWLQSPQWGVVFVPNVPQGWRPYQNGQWMENRFWLSGDPWGWATDHYGRWGFDEAMGWVWVPDTAWGPSWVAWREADEVVGWAPIPPRVSWSVGFGFGGGWGYDSWNSWYGPSWVWVPRSYFYTRGFGGRILPWNSGISWWGRSHWQHAPYLGWNRPWDRSWGWRAPRGYAGGGYTGGYAGGNRAYGNYRGNNSWGGGSWGSNNWGNRGWSQPRQGSPGSIGDRIGRDMTGRPPYGGGGMGRPMGGGRGWGGGGGGHRRFSDADMPDAPQLGQADPGPQQSAAAGRDGNWQDRVRQDRAEERVLTSPPVSQANNWQSGAWQGRGQQEMVMRTPQPSYQPPRPAYQPPQQSSSPPRFERPPEAPRPAMRTESYQRSPESHEQPH
ncbi:MAG: DUF6600 domain-containing protein [Sphingomonadales bacterium]